MPLTKQKHILFKFGIPIVIISSLLLLALYLQQRTKFTPSEYPSVDSAQQPEIAPISWDDQNLLDTPLPTLFDEPLQDFITYTLPGKWLVNNYSYDTKSSITFQSEDTTYYENSPFVHTGAYIRIFKYKNFQHTPLKKYIDAKLKNFEITTYDYPVVWINGYRWYHVFMCYEGCSDDYYSEKDNYIFEVRFVCNCHTQKEIDENIHATDRDTFLKSLRYK